MTAADRTPDHSPGPGAEQAASDRALARIIRIRAARQCATSPGNYAASDPPLHRSIFSNAALAHLTCRLARKSQVVGMGNASA
jgi:hypothetical protein